MHVCSHKWVVYMCMYVCVYSFIHIHTYCLGLFQSHYLNEDMIINFYAITRLLNHSHSLEKNSLEISRCTISETQEKLLRINYVWDIIITHTHRLLSLSLSLTSLLLSLSSSSLSLSLCRYSVSLQLLLLLFLVMFLFPFYLCISFTLESLMSLLCLISLLLLLFLLLLLLLMLSQWLLFIFYGDNVPISFQAEPLSIHRPCGFDYCVRVCGACLHIHVLNLL